MKRTKLQVFFAEDWLGKIWIGGIVTGATIGLLIHFLPTFAIIGVSFSSVGLGVAILLSSAIAYLGSLVLGSCLLPPIYRMRERINGAPFEEGDYVEIMKKPHRGKTARIAAAGDSQYGAFLILADDVADSKPINIPWRAIRTVFKAEPDGAPQPTTRPASEIQ